MTDYKPNAADTVAMVVPSTLPEHAKFGLAVRNETMVWQPPEGFSMGIGLPSPDHVFTPVPFYPGINT